jgi:hypothetical protein
MTYRVVSKRRTILIWVLVVLGSLVSMFLWRAGQQDLSFLGLPYFLIAYAIAVSIIGILYGLVIRMFLQATIKLLAKAKHVRHQSWLLSTFILVALAVTSSGLSLLTQVQVEGGAYQFLTCLILASTGLRGTLRPARSSA